jgi:hypothetical protein
LIEFTLVASNQIFKDLRSPSSHPSRENQRLASLSKAFRHAMKFIAAAFKL